MLHSEAFLILTEVFLTLTEVFHSLTEVFLTLTEIFLTPTEVFLTLTEVFLTLTVVLTCICLRSRLFSYDLGHRKFRDVTPGLWGGRETMNFILHTRYVSTCVGAGWGG
jgi:hypothetical protein